MLNVPNKRLASQAYEQLLDLILSGGVKPGELVNERRLATALNMSRTPVRDALLMLEGEGLLLRQGTRGLQVKQMRIDDFLDALSVRLLLEPAVARMAAGKIPSEKAASLRTQLEALMTPDSSKPAERSLVQDVDEELHGMIAAAAENPQLASIILMLRRRTRMFDLRSMPKRLVETSREHLAILNALERGDGEKASQAMTAHLNRVRESIITRLTRS